MDNLTHTLVGACLGRAGLDRLSPLAMPTVLIAANLPDVDAVSGFWGGLAYLDHHRGITHSFFGIAVGAPLLAALMTASDRLLRRNGAERPPAKFGWLVFVALCGLASHLLLDYTNSYGVRPWLPFSPAWTYGDLVFIVDPVIWLVLVGGLLLGTSGRPGLAGWALLGAALTAAVLRVRVVPPGMQLVWCAAIAVLALARWWGEWRSPRAALGALAVLLLYWGLLAVAHHDAVELARLDAPVSSVSALPELADPLRWRAYAETPQTLYVREVSVLEPRSRGTPWRAIERNLDVPEVRHVAGTYAGCVMNGFARYLVAEVYGSSPAAGVVLSDARFARPGRPSFATVRIPLDGAASDR